MIILSAHIHQLVSLQLFLPVSDLKLESNKKSIEVLCKKIGFKLFTLVSNEEVIGVHRNIMTKVLAFKQPQKEPLQHCLDHSSNGISIYLHNSRLGFLNDASTLSKNGYFLFEIKTSIQHARDSLCDDLYNY